MSNSDNNNNNKNEVTLHSKLTIVSSKPVGSVKTHALSVLDRAMPLHSLHIIYYYHNCHNLNLDLNLLESFDLDPLRASLCEVLTLYPTVTGRLARDQDGNWQVNCNDTGVRVIKATVHTTLHQWLSSASASHEKLLIAWDDMPLHPDTWSPFRIQINSFQGGGVAIGLSWNHMLADITFAASFFKSWTQKHLGLPITHPPSFTPLAIPKSLYGATFSTEAQKASSPPRNMATATFKFSNSVIKQCLSKVHHICPNATPFDFLTALFWTRIALLKPHKYHTETHSLSICTDFRSVLKTPLPAGHSGNALHFSMLTRKVEEGMDSAQLGDIVSLVYRHVTGLAEEDVWSAIRLLESPRCMYGPVLTCVCLEHLMIENDESLLYAPMFSINERPNHVSFHVGNVEGEGLIMVMPSSEGGLARTVMVTLPEEELGGLSSDETVLQLEPTMVLDGCNSVVDN